MKNQYGRSYKVCSALGINFEDIIELVPDTAEEGELKND